MERTPFGEYVRERREALQGRDSRFSQRQVALRIGIQPAYLSRIERGEAESLSEEKIIALACELEEDPDVLLALAGKISSDVREAIRRRPALFSSLIRDLDDLPDYAVLADKEYRTLENRLNEAQRLVHLGSWDRDLRSGEEYWSAQLYHILGYAPGEVPASLKTLLGHLLQVEENPLRKALETLDPGFFGRAFTCRFVRRDGVERVAHVLAHLEMDEEGVAVRVYGTLQDVTERVFWEEKHREQSRLLDRIFSNIHLLIAYLDPEFNFIRVNQAYAAADNRDPEFYVGRNHFELYPHEENERIFRRVVETGEEHHFFAKPFEYANNPERSVTCLDWSLTPVKGRDGSVEGLILALSDVTDKVRAREELQRAHDELEKTVRIRTEDLQKANDRLRVEKDFIRQAIEALDHPFYVIDAETCEILMANAATGLSGPESRPLCYTAVHCGTMPCGEGCPFEMLKQGKSAARVEHIHENGKRIVEILAFPVYGEQGKLTRVIESCCDITERKGVEEALRNLTRAVQQSPASIVITDVSGNITYVNPRFEHTTGYTASEVLGKNPRVFKSTLHPPEFYKGMWDTLTAGKEWRGEVCNRKKNGELYWETASISPMKDDKGRITHFLAVKEDITERKKAERLREDVERILRHDLKSPLNAIINTPDLVLNEGGLSRDQEDLLKRIEEAGTRMLQSIERSLDLVKMEMGRYPSAQEPVDLVRVLQGVAGELHGKSQAKGVGIDVGGPEGGDKEFRVLGEEPLCRSMFASLMTNAVEASPQGGRVAVRLAREGEWGVAAIRNDGAVPKEIRAAFFEKYVTHGKKGGTGLGAYVARLMAETQGGSIGFVTSEEEGTTVTVRLPLRRTGGQR